MSCGARRAVVCADGAPSELFCIRRVSPFLMFAADASLFSSILLLMEQENMSANCFRASSWRSGGGARGAGGAGLFKVLASCAAAAVTVSRAEVCGILKLCGRNSTVHTILSALELGNCRSYVPTGCAVRAAGCSL